MFILIGQQVEDGAWEVLGERDTTKDAAKQAQRLVSVNDYFEVKIVKEVESFAQ